MICHTAVPGDAGVEISGHAVRARKKTGRELGGDDDYDAAVEGVRLREVSLRQSHLTPSAIAVIPLVPTNWLPVNSACV